MIDARLEPRENEELQALIAAAWNGVLEPDQRDRLDELLLADDEAMELYLTCMAMHGRLLWQHRGATDHVKQWVADHGASEGFANDSNRDACIPAIVPVPCADPSHSLLGSISQGGWMLSYLTATVILGAMLLSAWAYKISHFEQIARPSTPGVIEDARMEYVAQITGMKDCRSTDGELPIYLGSVAALGRKFSLASGLLEITYRNGARVILEGPCEYTIDSTAGGWLQLGKLVARVESRGERREEGTERKVASGQWQVARKEGRGVSGGLAASAAGAKHQATNPQSPSPLFTITTPTAIVTDLGTEFGVEVDENGDTISHVFRGSVRVQLIGTGNESRMVQLGAGESARVEKKTNSCEMSLLTGNAGAKPPKFVRRVYESLKQIDLLDIVAGGNGTSNRREHGIDPATGMYDPLYVPQCRGGDRQYRPISWHRLIDGVFVPDGRAGTVKINSAGGAFDGFPDTNGDSWGSIWSRAADVKQGKLAEDTKYWMYAMGRGEQFMPQGRGLLCLCANAGITFDLEAMRKIFADIHPARFRATVGMVDAHFRTPAPTSMADVWVIVDGRVKFKRMKLRPEDGTLDVDVELGPRDRFLTLAFTDGGNDRSHDWLVFGDPVLKMSESEKK